MAKGTALIFGVSGQDGAYLARLLLDKGYVVHGVSRDADAQPFQRLRALGIRDRIVTHSASMLDGSSLRQLLLDTNPGEIYNLAGLSSVALSFASAEAAATSIRDAHCLLLENVRDATPQARVYHSASSECFAEMPAGEAADESTPFQPRSPYATAKAEAHRETIAFRERYGLFAVSALVFNHESPLRDEHFLTRKLVTGASAAARGLLDGKLHLGALSVSRDWGYAPEYVDAMWRMLQQKEAADCVLATGESHSVEELAAAIFAAFGLDHRDHVISHPNLLRPSDTTYSRGNPSRAHHNLGWTAHTKFPALVERLIETV